MSTPRVSVVIITRDRPDELDRALRELRRLPEEPPIVVIDDGSADGVPNRLRRSHRSVTFVELDESQGCAARNLGAKVTHTPYIAFNDDDSWWAPGSLRLAADVLDANPTVGLLAARVLVGDDKHLDPTCEQMTAIPAIGRRPHPPGHPVLGFLACGSVVRCSAFLGVGGFDGRFGIGGEEALLALDLAAAGWDLRYLPELVAHHHPSPVRDHAVRLRTLARNELWLAWRRLPLSDAARQTWSAIRGARHDATRRAGFTDAVRGIAHVAADRRVIPPHVADLRRTIEGVPMHAAVRFGSGEPG